MEIEKKYFYFFQISGRFLLDSASCCLETDMALVARDLYLPNLQVLPESQIFLIFCLQGFLFQEYEL